MFLSDEGPTLETLDFTIRVSAVNQPFLNLDLYLYTAYAAHYVYLIFRVPPCKSARCAVNARDGALPTQCAVPGPSE